MKNTHFICLGALLLFLTGCASQRIYIGGNDGIHLAEYKSRSILPWRTWGVEKIVPDSNVSYMAVNKHSLYAAHRIAKGVFGVEVFQIRGNGMLKKMDTFVIPGNQGYCHISVSRDGKYLFGSSYSGGFMDQLALVPGGGIVNLKKRFHFSGGSIHKRQGKSHPHFSAQTPDGSMVLTADLGCDKLHIFKYDGEQGAVEAGSVALPPGSGPRHLSFSADGKFVYCANELNNTVTSFKMEKGQLKIVSTCSLLPEAWSGYSYAGAIRTTPAGQICITNRGHNSIAILSADAQGKLKLENSFSSEGDYPYDFLFAQNKMFLVNMKSDQFSVWEKGKQWEKKAAFTLRRPMCTVQMVEKP